MDYMTAKEAGIKWGISKRWVLVLCKQNRILGTIRMGNLWLIPKNSTKPVDLRKQCRKVCGYEK